jgi:hypothetical protein
MIKQIFSYLRGEIMRYWIWLVSTLTVIILFFAFFVFDKEVTLNRWVAIGDSEHWRARVERVSYRAVGKNAEGRMEYDSHVSQQCLLVYKRNDPEKVGKVKYKFDIGSSQAAGSDHLSKDGIISHSGGGSGVYIEGKDAIIIVTVEWEGKKEIFELKCK